MVSIMIYDIGDDMFDEMESYEESEMILSKLNYFDGQNGRMAFVMVDGIVYDISESELYKNGYYDEYGVGKDLSEAFETELDRKILDSLPIIAMIFPLESERKQVDAVSSSTKNTKN